MGTLYLVRHGQASFGSDNYDQLSPLGHQQSLRLGEHWRAQGLVFDAVLTGTLQRQQQTWAGIAQGIGMADKASMLWPGLNEYDSEAVIQAIHLQPLAKPDSPERYRHHFRLLRDGLLAWMKGQTQPQGMPPYPEFLAGVTSALDHVRASHTGAVLLVSSGGPISMAVGHVLGLAPEATIELNLRIRNSAVTEFIFNPKRHTLLSFNTLPHLGQPEHAAWMTYA
jgi:broad specificity phosphatase PhoE